ncbi:chitosanase [Metarhizium album ARSEF 1941]|uniref:Endo-chitosanase n=1 Tax=Metarhizium album (strain ARSEF 1941) TaxID=1081103 RepID=A0A0B2X0K4_METAS|nr:chitosanase [Metarhizium album ARSEF 1941]KHN99374.1 chitosanase [Metarhizium album ARSEF 1941]
MKSSAAVSLSALAAVAAAAGREIPADIKNFYESVRGVRQCRNVLASGFHSISGDSGKFGYCGDRLDDYNIVYLQGQNGELVNMDIDCDGVQHGPADDGRCGSSGDAQSVTSFADTVRGYGTGQRDLDANVHPYVVFGNAGSRPGYANFDPRKHGIEPLSVMAVVCNNRLIYGVWGDENGDDGPEAMVGEASLALATACFGQRVNGNAGHDGNDVLYIAFAGKDAVPGASGAKWNAKSYDEFESSITALGDRLIQRIGGGGSPSSPPPSTGSCSWEGHCRGE